MSDELPLEEDVPLVDLVEALALKPQESIVVPVGGREALLDVAEELVVQADLVRVPGPLGLEAPAEQAAEGAVDEAEKAAPRLALGRPGLVDRARIGRRGRRLRARRGSAVAGPRPDARREGSARARPATDAERASSRTRSSSAATSSRSSPT